MNELESNPGAAEQDRLPFDVPTVLVSVALQPRLLASFALLSAIAGVVVAFLFGTPLYQAQSVLLYHPDSQGRTNDPALTVQTQTNMVLLDSNIEETRHRLNLDVPLKQLRAACDVRTQNNTALVMIDVLWKSPEDAARIANTLRDVFVTTQLRVQRAGAALEAEDLRVRITQVQSALKGIDAKLGSSPATFGTADPDKQTDRYLSDLQSTELLYSQALGEKQSVDSQLENAERILKSLRQTGSIASMGDLNMRYGRLRDAIHEDQSIRENLQKLELNKIEMERSKQLHDQGLIAKAEYDKAVLVYRAQQQIALDTAQVKNWRDRIVQIDGTMLSPDGDSANSKENMTKLFQLHLDQIAAAEKIKVLRHSLDVMRKKVDALPKMQRDYLTIAREAESKSSELKALEERLARAERTQMAKSGEFVPVSDAVPAASPAKSRRAIFFTGVTIFGTFLGLMVVLLREILNGTIRSAAEARLKLSVPLLGIVPRLAGHELSPSAGKPIPESMRALALHLQRAVPKAGSRILFVSSQQGEGVSTIVSNVAECLLRDRHETLLLEAAPVLQSIEAEKSAPSFDAVVLVVAASHTMAKAAEESIARIRGSGGQLAGVVLNRVDPNYL